MTGVQVPRPGSAGDRSCRSLACRIPPSFHRRALSGRGPRVRVSGTRQPAPETTFRWERQEWASPADGFRGLQLAGRDEGGQPVGVLAVAMFQAPFAITRAVAPIEVDVVRAFPVRLQPDL